MKPHALTASLLLAAALCGLAAETAPLPLARLATYQQGQALADLLETRQAVFHGTADDKIRAAREQALLAFIASTANDQAKAIAIEWLGCLGSSASVPGLLEAAKTPALAAPAAMALERIPGTEAATARTAKPAAKPALKPAAAEAAAFTAALTKTPAAADQLIVAALRSPNELLAGAALRRIRTGAGSPAILQACAGLPAGREAMLYEALAVRPDAEIPLRDHLRKLLPSLQAIITMGRVLNASDLPLMLTFAAHDAKPDLAKAAQTALARATDAAINPALIETAGTTNKAVAVAAIEALVARRAVDAAPALTTIARANDPATSAAAWKALGLLMKPDQLADVLDQLARSAGQPAAASLLKLVWDVARRHPDPAAAADLLERAARSAPDEVNKTLSQYAARIRPKNAPKQATYDLPKQDDRLKLGPNGGEEVIYLNSGTSADATSGKVRIRRTAGESHTFGPLPHALASVDFGKQVSYEITGLDPAGEYVLGLSAWDADQGQRRQSLEFNGRVVLRDFAPLAWHADQPTYTRIHLPLTREFTTGGKLAVTMKAEAGPNAVVSEIWILRTKPSSNKRVLVLTGDDFSGHHWRETGPRFAEILRSDPRLEVTIGESPALLGSPLLTTYDAVFLHFKNYAARMPVADAAWKNLEAYVNGGGGLVIAHFGCGAAQEWTGFVNVAGRVWDPKKRGHDPYGAFLVRILNTGHPVVRDLKDFTTTDELYTCLAGNTQINVLAEATSKVDQSVHPMAFVLTPGKGRVFHSPLGHNTAALNAEGACKLYLQGTLWTAGLIN